MHVSGVINRYDPQDPTSLTPATRSRIAEETQSAAKTRRGGLRIGVPREYNIEELSPIVGEAWRKSLEYLQSQGHTVHPVSLPTTDKALSTYYVLGPAEASSNLARYDGVRYGTRDEDVPDNAGGALYAKTRDCGLGSEVKHRILLGAFTLSAEAMDNYFIQAQKVRRLVQLDFNEVFRLEHPLHETPPPAQEGGPDVDVLVCPTTFAPPPLMRHLDNHSPIESYVNDVFTVPASLAGLPALSVPVPVDAHGHGEHDSRVGIQVIGQFGDDKLVLDVGSVLEGMEE